jgi:SpoVK/Ycf46/Vps4 family AAA+-type ATPase
MPIDDSDNERIQVSGSKSRGKQDRPQEAPAPAQAQKQPENAPAKKKDTDSSEAKDYYAKAGRAFEENDFQKSIDMYTKAIEIDPNYSSAYFNRALSYAILNMYTEATRDAETVMDLEPESYDAPYIMGIVSEYQKDYQGAKEWYEKSLAKNPDYEQARARLEQLTVKLTEEQSQSAPGAQKTKVGGDQSVIEEGQLKQVKWHKSNISFKDVVGMDKEKDLIYQNIILAIKKPELLKVYGKKLGLGVIFYGPPGCGKTYFVNAIAGETGSNVMIARINEIVDMYAGNTEKNMHRIFQQARENTPVVLFFDELDALGVKRESGGGESQNFMRMAVNQFLQEMDGIEKNPEGIFIIGATNQPWDIDPALKRSKRFGEAIYIPPPDYKTRKQAFIFNTRRMPIAGINFGRLARATTGFSQADIEEICDKAALIPAAEEDRTGKRRNIKMKDFLRMIKTHGNTLDEWYAMMKKEIISKMETQIVDGKKQTIVKEGKLTPEEKSRYKPLIKDVKRNSNKFLVFLKKLVRSFSLRVV